MNRRDVIETFAPRLDVLPTAQRALWSELGATPDDFTLYGGTAIALQLGHRQSVDFDFFGAIDFDPDDLVKRVPYLKGGRIVQSAASTLSVWLDRGGSAKISYFGVPEIGQVEPHRAADDIGVKIASLVDLAGLKTVVVQSRAESKDFVDLDAMIAAGVALPTALAAATIIQGSSYNPQVSLKALSYFEDGDLKSLDAGVRSRLRAAVLSVDLKTLPKLSYLRRYGERRNG